MSVGDGEMGHLAEELVDRIVLKEINLNSLALGLNGLLWGILWS